LCSYSKFGYSYANHTHSNLQLSRVFNIIMRSACLSSHLKCANVQEIVNNCYAGANLLMYYYDGEFYNIMAKEFLIRNPTTIKFQHYCNMLYAFSVLNIHHHELFFATAEILLQRFQSQNSNYLLQDLLVTIWSYTIYYNSKPFFGNPTRVIRELLCLLVKLLNAIPTKEFTVFQLRQLHQFTLSQILVLPNFSRKSTTDDFLNYSDEVKTSVVGDDEIPLLSIELRRLCHSSLHSKSDHRRSDFQIQVEDLLKKMGIGFKDEVVLPCGYNIDILITDGRYSSNYLCIEVQGPFHFRSDKQYNGPTILKQNHLKALGYNIINVAYFDASIEQSLRQQLQQFESEEKSTTVPVSQFPNNDSNINKEAREKPQIQCFKCQKFGHYQGKCTRKQINKYKPSK
jgi:hypothetical protein